MRLISTSISPIATPGSRCAKSYHFNSVADRIAGRFSFREGSVVAHGRFAVGLRGWSFGFTVDGVHDHYHFALKDGALVATAGVGCFDCAGIGNVGAFEGLNNASSTSGNYNTGLLNGDFNGGTRNGNHNVGVFNGNFNGMGYSVGGPGLAIERQSQQRRLQRQFQRRWLRPRSRFQPRTRFRHAQHRGEVRPRRRLARRRAGAEMRPASWRSRTARRSHPTPIAGQTGGRAAIRTIAHSKDDAGPVSGSVRPPRRRAIGLTPDRSRRSSFHPIAFFRADRSRATRTTGPHVVLFHAYQICRRVDATIADRIVAPLFGAGPVAHRPSYLRRAATKPAQGDLVGSWAHGLMTGRHAPH